MASTSELSIVLRMAGSGLPRRTAVKVGTGAIATTLILAWLRMSKARRFDCQRSARSPSPLKRKNPENRYEALHEPRQERRTIWGISRHIAEATTPNDRLARRAMQSARSPARR